MFEKKNFTACLAAPLCGCKDDWSQPVVVGMVCQGKSRWFLGSAWTFGFLGIPIPSSILPDLPREHAGVSRTNGRAEPQAR